MASAIHLSPRQEEVLSLIAAGLTDKEIAIRLGLRQRTVRTHLERLYARHGFHNRAGAISVWLRSQLAAERAADALTHLSSGPRGGTDVGGSADLLSRSSVDTVRAG